MMTSDERCPRPATRTLAGADLAPDDRAPERGLNAESADLSRLAALLRRACGPSMVGAVVGRARLQDELTRHLGCSAPMARSIVDTMIARGLIRQEVHRDGWVHWVVTV